MTGLRCEDCDCLAKRHRRDLSTGWVTCEFCQSCRLAPRWESPVHRPGDLSWGRHVAEARFCESDLTVYLWTEGESGGEWRAATRESDKMPLDEVVANYVSWRARNFDPVEVDRLLLKLVGEVGELVDAHTAESHGGSPDDTRKELGDVIAYTIAVASRRGWDWSEILRETWDKVRRRDYRKYPMTGDRDKELARRREQGHCALEANCDHARGHCVAYLHGRGGRIL